MLCSSAAIHRSASAPASSCKYLSQALQQMCPLPAMAICVAVTDEYHT